MRAAALLLGHAHAYYLSQKSPLVQTLCGALVYVRTYYSLPASLGQRIETRPRRILNQSPTFETGSKVISRTVLAARSQYHKSARFCTILLSNGFCTVRSQETATAFFIL